MKRWMGLMLLGAVLWMGWPSEVRADTCETRLDTDNPDFPVNKPAPVICDTHGQVRTRAGQATTTAPALAEGTITGFSYDLNGNARVTLGGTSSSGGLGTATEVAPTLSEGAGANFSFDLAGNARVTMGTLLSGEDQTNNLIQTSGGATRLTTFSSVTSATSSSVTTVPTGPKTFVAQIINATSETKAATLIIYGNLISSVTGGIAICTIILPSTATTLQLQDACPVTEVNFPFYFYTASVYTSASTAPLTVYAAY